MTSGGRCRLRTSTWYFRVPPVSRWRWSSSGRRTAWTYSGFKSKMREDGSPRDRNVLGIQSDLLGAAGLGIKALLVVGGDPLKIGDYPQAKPVGEIDTLGLLRIVKGLNIGTDLAGGAIGSATSFAIACAANPAARDLDVEISKLAAKIEAGATFAQTQPVYDVAALDRFYTRAEAHAIPILIGLIPPKSLKQALDR